MPSYGKRTVVIVRHLHFLCLILTVKQWVSGILNFSSEYSEIHRHATYLEGRPDIYPLYRDILGAWAPRLIDSPQFIELEYEEAVFIHAINIYETFNAGGVKVISGRGPEGYWHTLWETTQVEYIDRARIFAPPLQYIDYRIKDIRIDVDCSASHSYVAIDAIQMIGARNSTGKLNILVDSP